MKLINKTRLCSLAVAAIVTVSCVALTGCGGKKDSAAASPAASTSTAASAENAGTCGEGVTWALADGTLTVGGTGRMTNFTSDNQAPLGRPGRPDHRCEGGGHGHQHRRCCL